MGLTRGRELARVTGLAGVMEFVRATEPAPGMELIRATEFSRVTGRGATIDAEV